MKKYSILLILTALAGCSLLPPEMMSKEFIAEDIEGKDIPTALDNLTIIYGKTELRFTNGYISIKGDTFETYAARIVKMESAGANEFKLFISDGSRQKGKLRVNALYITNAANNIHGYGLSNNVNIDAPFPEVYTPSSSGSSEGKIYLNWGVDEANKPTPLPPTHQGTYKSAHDPYMGTRIYTVSAEGIVVSSEGGQYGGGYTPPEEKFLRVVPSGAAYECYTANGAYKIEERNIYTTGRSIGQTPGDNATFGPTPDATR